MTKSSSTYLNSLLEETNTFDNSLPESEIFCFDLEEISSGSTTTRFDISLPDYEAFYDDHVKEISSGSTTTHFDSFLYESFIFDLSINQFPSADRSDFYEFADELSHIISPPEYDCFCFKNKPNSGDFTMDVVEDIFPTREPRVYNSLPTHPTLQLNLDFILSSESLFAYVVWIFLPFLSYSFDPQYLLSFGNEDTIFDPGICSYHISSFMPDVFNRKIEILSFFLFKTHSQLQFDFSRFHLVGTRPSKGKVISSELAFDSALNAFNVKMEIDLLSNLSEIAAPKLMKKQAYIYFTSVTQMVESTFSLSARQMALWKSQIEDHTSDWLRVVPIFGLGQTMNGRTYRCVLCYRLGVPLFSVSKPCSACSRVFMRDIYGDHAVSCAGIVGIKHRHNVVRDTLVDICYRSGISSSKEVDIGLCEERDKSLRPSNVLLYSWDVGRDVCVDLTGSSPLTHTGMVDFVPGCAPLDPSYLDGEADTFKQFQNILKTSITSASAWVGEAGGAYNSGHNLVTNAFVFSFWYLDQLGMSSVYNTKTYCRQTLIGETMVCSTLQRLRRIQTTTGSALLWHRLMGRKVLSANFTGPRKYEPMHIALKNL
uniref:Heparanase-like protein 3 n=1 Tax=Tanacetum cinerariifolium TaxID=118510 RepID=A0A6L2JB24_TANCI|nr:heparanase-like protein 3 [Tanacetum cinerariifolium]